MATIADELNAISVEHGYTGAAPKTIADAIDALADTLAGEDVKSGRSIAGAIHALAPYIGSGGGAALGPLVGVGAATTEATIYVSTTPYDIMSGETSSDVDASIRNNTNVFQANVTGCYAPSGCYVVVKATVSSGWTTDNLTVYDANGEQQITSGFDCRMVSKTSYANAYFTMQIPATGLAVDFGGGGGD